MSRVNSILLIEDNEDDWEATRRSFKKNHFLNPIKRCKSGSHALDYLNTKSKLANSNEITLPDLILLDLNMPGIDGRQFLKIIKSEKSLKKIPVIILTTSVDERDIDQCYELGASSYIQKPVIFDGLTEAIKAMKEYWFGIAILPQTTPKTLQQGSTLQQDDGDKTID